MDIVKIQALISQGKIVTSTDVDPTKVYVQVGVYQEGTRQQASGDANAYAPYVISLDEIIGGNTTPTTGTVILKATISLKDSAIQTLAFPTTGLYVVESALVTNASTDLSSLGVINLTLTLPNNSGEAFDTALVGPPASDLLNLLYSSDNYIYMTSGTPPCFPPPCNGSFVYDGATIGTMNFEVVTPTVSEANVDVYVKLIRLA